MEENSQKRGRKATGPTQTPQNFKIDNDLRERIKPYLGKGGFNRFANTAIRERLDRLELIEKAAITFDDIN